jgi:dephospho-CoA kinase
LSRKVIGISGEIAAGKTTIAKYPEGKGYFETRYSGVLQELLEQEGKQASRRSLQEIGEWLTKKKDSDG